MEPLVKDYDRAVQLINEGGWRVVVVPRPESTTVALRWVVAAGGCHDGNCPGLSHLTEHLVFHTAGRGRRDLLGELEALGAEVGSRTTREYTDFHAVVAAPHRAGLLGLVPALARAPALGKGALAREKAAVRVELEVQGTPSRALWDLLLEALWGDDPLARPAGGTPASVHVLTPRQVATHHAARFLPTYTVLAVAGACSVDEVCTAAAGLPAAVAGPAVSASAPIAPAPLGPRALHRTAAIEVAHVAVAVPVPGMTHLDRSALRLLDYILGRGGSSRLYRELRERRGLAYTCSSVYMPYAEAGIFAAQAVCAPERAPDVLMLLGEALCDLAQDPPAEAELRAAQQRYAGALHRTFETNANLASILAVETLLAEWEPFETAVARVRAVEVDELGAVARRYLDPARLVAASIGPARAIPG